MRLTHVSPDGDEGWPGTLSCEVTYRLSEQGLFSIEMEATTDRATYVNLIHHGYFNLAGHASGLIDDHLLAIAAETYLPKGEINVPTGEVASVAGTPFDFRTAKAVGRDVGDLPNHGYDQNWCLEASDDRPQLRLVDPKSGRALSLRTNQPGVQVFTANAWKNLAGKDGAVYQARAGIAFETQSYPNAPNIPAFNLRPLRPGETYRHEMAIQFEALTSAEVERFASGGTATL